MSKHLLILLALFPGFAVGQDLSGNDKQNNLNSLGGEVANTVRPMRKKYEGMSGNPYMLTDYRPGKLTIEESKSFDGILINVDLLLNEFLVKKVKTEQPRVVDLKKFNSAEIQIDFDSSLIVKKIDLGKHGITFGWQLATGKKGEVLVRIVKRIKHADYSGAYSRGTTVDEIYDEFEYYFISSNNPAPQQFSMKRKQIVKVFPAEAELINNYLAKNNVDFSNYSDLRPFFSTLLQ